MSKKLKDIFRESWENFRNPAKQSIENFKDSIKYDIPDTIADIRDGNLNAGGCLKKILVWGLIIVLISMIINSCIKEVPENTGGSSPTQSSDVQKNVVKDDIGDDEIQENSDQIKSDSYTEDVSDNDFYFLDWQTEYAKQHGIELNEFQKEKKELLANVDALDGNFCYVTQDSSFGADRYKATVEQSAYIYAGDQKNNYPDGFGVLFKESDVCSGLQVDKDYGALELNGVYYNFVYVGNFDEGRFDGYGLQYNVPEAYDYSLLLKLSGSEISDDVFQSYYLGWLNYVSYDGMFKKGKSDGKGNNYYANLESQIYFSGSIENIELANVQYNAIIVGEFKKDIENGKCKMYAFGNLVYDGEMKDGKKNGYGSSYDIDGNLEYQGNYKNDKKNGKGTLYNPDGSIVYEGNWKADDYK